MPGAARHNPTIRRSKDGSSAAPVQYVEPWHGVCRQIAAGGLRCPDLNQRHQASFSLVALCVSGVSRLIWREGWVPLAFGMASHIGFPSGRLTSSNEGTWVLSHQASSTAPQTSQDAPPVWATKNFSSVRLYSAPQLHRTIVAILRICPYGTPDQPQGLSGPGSVTLPQSARKPPVWPWHQSRR